MTALPPKPPNFDPLRFSPPPQATRRALIEKAAYLRAACRNFAPGHELKDWVEAEAEVNLQLGPGR